MIFFFFCNVSVRNLLSEREKSDWHCSLWVSLHRPVTSPLAVRGGKTDNLCLYFKLWRIYRVEVGGIRLSP